MRNDSGIVDQLNLSKQRDVLPHFGLARNRLHFADLLLLQRVDNAALSDVRIADESHADLLFVLVEQRQLTKQIEESRFSEAVLEGRVISQRRISRE